MIRVTINSVTGIRDIQGTARDGCLKGEEHLRDLYKRGQRGEVRIMSLPEDAGDALHVKDYLSGVRTELANESLILIKTDL